MTSEQLTQQLMKLPLHERVALAQALWQSIHEVHVPDTADDESVIIEQARRRDAELTSGIVAGRSHEQVMGAARRARERD